MDDTLEQDEIRPLTFIYAFHLMLFILLFLLHLLISSKVYWVSKKYYILFLLGIYLGILNFLFPIFPFYIIIWKKFKKKIFQILKTLTLAFLIVSIIIGLFISAIILINTINSKTFIKECPFSITISHLNYIFEKFYDKNPSNNDIKDLCKSRRCILDEVNDNYNYPYKYLCNYNPISDINQKGIIYKRNSLNGNEITSNTQIKCELVGESFMYLPLKHNEIFKYLTLCNYLNDFYYCERFDKPEKEYEIDNGESCPEEVYLLLLYILCAVIFLFDILMTMMSWGLEYISLLKIVRMMNMTRRKPNSHNSTQKSSIITKNNEESFKTSKTEVIIVSSNNEEEIINVNKKKLNIQDDDNINNEENRNNIQPIKIGQNWERNKINSSNNIFGNNEQNISTENNLGSQIEISPINIKKK